MYNQLSPKERTLSKAKFIILEIIQFAPIITFASSFVVSGEVDLSMAGNLFLLAGGLASIITVVVVFAKGHLNPVLLGTNVWLLVGAASFGLAIETMMDFLSEWQASALFGCVLLTGIVLTLRSRRGFIGMDAEPSTIKRASLVLIVLTALAVVCSVLLKDNIRLGGGLPFIVLNVSRRIVIRRLSK